MQTRSIDSRHKPSMSTPTSLLLLQSLLLILSVTCSHPSLALHSAPNITVQEDRVFERWVAAEEDRVLWTWNAAADDGLVPFRRSLSDAPPSSELLVENTSLVLAADRTHRKDPLHGFDKYGGGWNISNRHYWASVGFTAAPLFAIGVAWFLLFGLTLSILCCRHFCCHRMVYTYSSTAYALSLVMLILFTCASIVGSIVLYTGQGKFHASTTTTLDYVVGQADVTVGNLRDFSDKLSAAKKVQVDQVFLPGNMLSKIDEVVTKANTSANTLDTRASDNSEKIHNVLDFVRLILIVLAAGMLLLAFLGFLVSIFGLHFIVYIFVLIGWVLIAGTFILSGVFLLFHNVVGDTCVSMRDWVGNPQAHTALDDILPCVDSATANESLYQGRQVTFQLVNVVNTVIVNVSNGNFPYGFFPVYYNQSGPQMPKLCNPYGTDLSNRNCVAGEVDLNNATEVWRRYVCNVTVVSGNDVCTTVGRVTPRIYNQMGAAVSVSYGLNHYGPFLAQLEDCTFVRQTFATIDHEYCPSLRRYSSWIYIGLAMVSSAVMLSLVFWVIYAKERKHRRCGKRFLDAVNSPFEGK